MEQRVDGYFRRQAATYRSARPVYPPELYAWVGEHAPGRRLVWDCGTGNGQAAVGLAEVFDEVVATNVAAEQIERAMRHERVRYAVASASSAPLGASSVDAVVAATAVHWFDRPAFWAEARRVLRPGGLVAVWAYGGHDAGERVGAVTKRFAAEVVGPFWSDRLDVLQGGYADLGMPFEPVEAPGFVASKRVDLAGYMGFLGSWSAAQRYRDAHGSEPLDRVRVDLEAAWGDPMASRVVTWDVFMKAGRVS